jgi:hypothetical protein
VRRGRGLVAEAEAVRAVDEPAPPAVHLVGVEADVRLGPEELAVFVLDVS